MPEDAVIDYDFMSKITEAGYSRIPVTKSVNGGTGDITGKIKSFLSGYTSGQFPVILPVTSGYTSGQCSGHLFLTLPIKRTYITYITHIFSPISRE